MSREGVEPTLSRRPPWEEGVREEEGPGVRPLVLVRPQAQRKEVHDAEWGPGTSSRVVNTVASPGDSVEPP